MSLSRVKILVLMLFIMVHSCSPSQQPETTFKITVDPRIELMNIALTFTDFPYFGKISDEKYKYYQDVIRYFNPYKNHEAIRKCASFPYFQDISFPDQMVLYLSDPPKMELKHAPPVKVTKQAMDDFFQLVDLLNQFANDSKFMKFWEDHQVFYDSIIDHVQNKMPYHEYLKIVNDFYGTQTSEYGCIISPILYGAAFGPTLEKNGTRIPFYVTGPDRIENGKPVFTDRWLRLLIFHEYGHSFVNPLCEKHRDYIMNRDSLLQYFNKYKVIKNTYDNWFIVVHEHIVRAVENLLLKKAGLELESKENLKKNLNHGFILIPYLCKKLEYYDSHRREYPTFENYFPELLKVFQEVDVASLVSTETSDIPELERTDSNREQTEASEHKEEQIKQIVDKFFEDFNKKNLGGIKKYLHQDISVSRNKGNTAYLILETAMDQIAMVDSYSIENIIKESGTTKVTGTYTIAEEVSDFTFLLDDNGKFLVIDMFKVVAPK